MTREEEIITASHNEKNYPCGIISDKKSHPIIFQIGAKWADQNPRKGLWDAEKVCKWISERIGIDQKIETDSDGEPLADSYIAYCIARQNAADTMIKYLRKAMEE